MASSRAERPRTARCNIGLRYRADNLLLQDLTITRGNADHSFGEGILTNGDLTLQRVAVTDSTSDIGGGIYVSAGKL